MNVKPAQLGTMLQGVRQRRGLTQAELARAAGMKQGSLSLLEGGQRLPSLPNLLRLSDALEVSVDYLLGKGESPSYKGRVSEDLAIVLEELPKRDVELLHLLAKELAKRQAEVRGA